MGNCRTQPRKRKSHLEFRLIEEKKKTIVLGVHNVTKDENIGYIRWDGAWRKYIYEDSWIKWDAQCLRDIADKLDQINDHHKNTKK